MIGGFPSQRASNGDNGDIIMTHPMDSIRTYGIMKQCEFKEYVEWGFRIISFSDFKRYKQKMILLSWILEAARLDCYKTVSLWNLTGISAALPRCLSNFRAIEKVWTQISRLWDLARSCGKTSYRLVKRGPGYWYRHIGYKQQWPTLLPLFLFK